MIPGTKPKPTAIRRGEGNPGKRKLGGDRALPPEIPVCPRWLDREGKRVWRELCDELFTLGVIRTSDRMALANLCDACSLMLSARRALEQLPEQTRMLVKAGASFQVNPLLSIINRQREMIYKLSAEFGLTPSSRGRLMGEDGGGATPVDELEALVSGDGSDPRFAEPLPIN